MDYFHPAAAPPRALVNFSFAWLLAVSLAGVPATLMAAADATAPFPEADAPRTGAAAPRAPSAPGLAVARIDTGRSQAGAAGNMEQALQELRRFAERAGLYGRQP